MSDLIAFAVVLVLYLLAILFVITGIYFLISVARSMRRIAQAQEVHAAAQKDRTEAVWDIATSLDIFLVDDGEESCDSTRLIRAVEKLAGIDSPAADPKAGDGAME